MWVAGEAGDGLQNRAWNAIFRRFGAFWASKWRLWALLSLG